MTCAECMTNLATLCPDCAHKIMVEEVKLELQKYVGGEYPEPCMCKTCLNEEGES